MKRTVRQAITFLAILFVVSLLRLPYGSYKESLLPRLKTLAAQMQIRTLDAKDIALSFPFSLQVDELGMLVPVQGFPVPFFVNSMSGSLGFLPLLKLRTDLNANGKLYSGDMTFVGSRPIFGRGGKSTLVLKDLKLESHPTFLALGAKGTLGLEFEGSAIDDAPSLKSIENAHLKLHLREAEFNGKNPWIPLVKIPPITGINLNAEAGFKGDRLTINQAQLKSSVGDAQGTGSMVLNELGRVTSGALDFQIKLSSEGVAAFGGYLALAARIPVENPPSDWKVNVRFVNGRAEVVLKPA